ncbi:hypothetical protein B0J12DRAFT_320529 [Macrophomina phaseolina]|uniref:Uncharacterized protein n=1 Tax=Macrophomina phaseolina TaxID=35725 RepID=A0ABQ8FYJ6_9PEZI|nr:hypothetical protein B0J12DRAFT_320529 [Macrophomina phaseolina]
MRLKLWSASRRPRQRRNAPRRPAALASPLHLSRARMGRQAGNGSDKRGRGRWVVTSSAAGEFLADFACRGRSREKAESDRLTSAAGMPPPQHRARAPTAQILPDARHSPASQACAIPIPESSSELRQTAGLRTLPHKHGLHDLQILPPLPRCSRGKRLTTARPCPPRIASPGSDEVIAINCLSQTCCLHEKGVTNDPSYLLNHSGIASIKFCFILHATLMSYFLPTEERGLVASKSNPHVRHPTPSMCPMSLAACG